MTTEAHGSGRTQALCQSHVKRLRLQQRLPGSTQLRVSSQYVQEMPLGQAVAMARSGRPASSSLVESLGRKFPEKAAISFCKATAVSEAKRQGNVFDGRRGHF